MKPNEPMDLVTDIMDLANKWQTKVPVEDFVAALGAVAGTLTPGCQDCDAIVIEFIKRYIETYDDSLAKLLEQHR